MPGLCLHDDARPGHNDRTSSGDVTRHPHLVTGRSLGATSGLCVGNGISGWWVGQWKVLLVRVWTFSVENLYLFKSIPFKEKHY